MSGLRYLYFPGCKLEPQLPVYDRTTRAVMADLDVDLDRTELNCCGYPVRHMDFTASMMAAARVLAVAAEKGLPILTPCQCCFGNLKQADYWLQRNDRLRQRIEALLRPEGLLWTPGVTVRHLLTALTADVGLEALRARIRRPLAGVNVAAHYGCHALRPGDVTQFDDPLAPSIFEKVLHAAGATPVDWPLRLDCCGAPLWKKNNSLALRLMERKLSDVRAAGAQILATACTYCQNQFGSVRQSQSANLPEEDPTVVLLPQLLGMAMGIPDEILGFPINYIRGG